MTEREVVRWLNIYWENWENELIDLSAKGKLTEGKRQMRLTKTL